MKKTAAAAVLCIALGLFCYKSLFPESALRLIRSAEALLPELGREELLREEGWSAAVSGAVPAYSPPLTETALISETALSAGEHYPAPESAEPEPPAVVSAFLESQQAFSEYELPEDVSYAYEHFPLEYAVPVAGYNSSGFGYRLHPIHGDVRFHYGTDFAAWTGESILAFARGEVSFAGYCDSYGNYVTIEHPEGWQSLYAHCSRLYVETGDAVEAGQLIALVGDTGLATGPHLHFELSHRGVYVNPEYYVNS